jgi:hypothetical protein
MERSMVDVENMTEEETEAYVRELATNLLATAIDVPIPLFILAAIEASVRATIAANIDDTGAEITSGEALEKLKLVIFEVHRIETEGKPANETAH